MATEHNLKGAIKSIQVLNVDKTESTISSQHMHLQEIFDSGSFIVSDADEELLILIEFQQFVQLNFVKLYAIGMDEDKSEFMSAPKNVHVYKTKNSNKTFDDIKSMKKPDKSIRCTMKKLKKGQKIKFQNNTIKFNKVQHIALYIESNQRDTETTYFNGIEFYGKAKTSEIVQTLIKKEEFKNDSKNDQRLFKKQTIEYDKTDSQNTMKLITMTENFKSITDDHDIVRMQTLDVIHSYYFHSFDIGYKFTTADRELFQKKSTSDFTVNYDPSITQISSFIRSKRESYSKISELSRLSNENINKFRTVVNEDIKDDKNNLDEYSFGYRYYYWPHYKNNLEFVDRSIRLEQEEYLAENDGYTLGYWYIEPHFKDLKTELLSHGIGLSQWNRLWLAAGDKVRTERAKEIRCHQIMLEVDPIDIYEIAADSIISCGHLLAMMVYCNFDKLQYDFTSTYRKIGNETDSSLKQRHSKYHHLGKLLRENVECFGSADVPTRFHAGHLYHGMTINAKFRSLDARFHGPVSTTTDFAVAINFCGDMGIIMEVKLDWSWCYQTETIYEAYFDCHWLSDFTNEQEVFFVGGYSNLSIQTILTPSGHNYGHYCKAITQFSGTLAGWRGSADLFNQPFSKFQQKLIFTLLCNEMHNYYPKDEKYHKFEDVPKYVEDLFHNECISITNIHLRGGWLSLFNDFKQKLIDAYFMYDWGWIKLDLLTTIFPSVKQIKM
eukprot:473481_1